MPGPFTLRAPTVQPALSGLELIRQRFNPLQQGSPLSPTGQFDSIRSTNQQLTQASQAAQQAKSLRQSFNAGTVQPTQQNRTQYNMALSASRTGQGTYADSRYNQIANWARQGGWAEKDIPMAIAIAMAESGGNPGATHANAAGGGKGVDRGVWQVNDYWQRQNPAVLQNPDWGTNPVSNAKAAYQAFKSGGGWEPWSTFKGGQYAKYLKQPSGYTTAAVQPFVATTPSGSIRTNALKIAQHAEGVPYVWGGNSLSQGVDCSGLVQQTYKALGVSLPRTADQQAHSTIGTRTSIANLKPGDLVAWPGNRKGQGPNFVGHIAIYMGNGRIIEAPDIGLKVRERNLRAGENVYGVALKFAGE